MEREPGIGRTPGEEPRLPRFQEAGRINEQSELPPEKPKYEKKQITPPTWCESLTTNAKVFGLGVGYTLCGACAIGLFPVTIPGYLVASASEKGSLAKMAGSVLGAPIFGAMRCSEEIGNSLGYFPKLVDLADKGDVKEFSKKISNLKEEELKQLFNRIVDSNPKEAGKFLGIVDKKIESIRLDPQIKLIKEAFPTSKGYEIVEHGGEFQIKYSFDSKDARDKAVMGIETLRYKKTGKPDTIDTTKVQLFSRPDNECAIKKDGLQAIFGQGVDAQDILRQIKKSKELATHIPLGPKGEIDKPEEGKVKKKPPSLLERDIDLLRGRGEGIDLTLLSKNRGESATKANFHQIKIQIQKESFLAVAQMGDDLHRIVGYLKDIPDTECEYDKRQINELFSFVIQVRDQKRPMP